jgi:hypothetical protein
MQNEKNKKSAEMTTLQIFKIEYNMHTDCKNKGPFQWYANVLREEKDITTTQKANVGWLIICC